MSSASLEQLKEKLLSCLDEERNVTNMTGALEAITNLQSVTITKEVLEATRMGLLVNDIRRKNQETNPQLGKLCRGLIKDWQKLVAGSSNPTSTGIGKMGISPGLERLSTPSGRTATPRQTQTAKLIAESGLRCSPSPASTPKLQPSTPVIANGNNQRGPAASSSYAPTEPQPVTTNGPGLKIRIKYGSADQQTSIVREIEQTRPVQEESKKGAEEAANRRKRKVSSEQSSRPVSGLVNGGSNSVSPCTSLPSPSPRTVENAASPAATLEPNQVATKVSKLAKKSKSASPATSIPNILQRPKLKSTAELVAEMTVNYPETMSVSLKNVVPTPASPRSTRPVSMSIMRSVLASRADGSSDASDFEDVDDAKDEDYVEPGISKRKAKITWTASFVNEQTEDDLGRVNKAELIDRYLRQQPGGGKTVQRKTSEDKSIDQSETRLIPVRSPIDWYASVELPPIDFSVFNETEETGEVAESMKIDGKSEGNGDQEKPDKISKVQLQSEEICDRGEIERKLEETGEAGVSGISTQEWKFLDPARVQDDSDETQEIKPGYQCRSRLLKTTWNRNENRRVLALPYIDIGMPDFLEFGYSDRERYLAHWSDR